MINNAKRINCIEKARLYKKILCLVLILVLGVSVLSGCGKKEQPVGDVYQVYFLSEDGNSIVPVEVFTEATKTEDVVDFLVECLKKPENPAYKAVLNNGAEYNGIIISEGLITIDFTSDMNHLPTYMAVLIRAALTRTFTQISGINAVSCTVNGSAMLDSTGAAIDPMSADSFIESAGAQINPDEKTMLTLYFADEEGDHLVKVKREVTYSSNISLDKLVVEQLLAGPKENENAYTAMNPSTKILSVTTQDGTCYVNLDSTFILPFNNVSTDVAIYSIVDSLIEIGTINKVQFYIDGKADVTYKETVNFSTPFVRNLDIIDE